MKKVNFALIVVAIISVLSAVAGKPAAKPSLARKYHVLFSHGSRLYVEDISNYASGVEYDCIESPGLCTFNSTVQPFYDAELCMYYFNSVILFLTSDKQDGYYLSL